MRYISILQSRTSSARLPGKCFLPLAGMPLVELCAKRTDVDFAESWVATSGDPSDDLLAKRLEFAGVLCFRGSLENVLERFCVLCRDQNISNEDTVIRLTGDNPIVDKFFLHKMKSVWESNNLDYLSGEPNDLLRYGWPKGLSAEFFKAGALYEAYRGCPDSYSCEHVTPSIKENAKNSAHMARFQKFNRRFMKGFSVDNLTDYLRMAQIFESIDWDTPYEKILTLGDYFE